MQRQGVFRSPAAPISRLQPFHAARRGGAQQRLECVSAPEKRAGGAAKRQPSAGAPPAAVPPAAPAAAPAPPSLELSYRDEEGAVVPVMPADYGFRSGAGRLYQKDYGTIPTSAWHLGLANFKKELRALRRSVRYDRFSEVSSSASPGPLRSVGFKLGGLVRQGFEKLDLWLEEKEVLGKLAAPKDARADRLTPEQEQLLGKLRQLRLDDKRVAERERHHAAVAGEAKVSLPIRLVYNSLCWLLDVMYEGRPIQRFWVLETVARIPYFTYISMLHLYESLGWWRAGAELRKVHFAEEWNELHHLQIMESLGGDLLWADRFVAEHAALLYYWLLIAVYLVSPSQSYAFMELVENHAVCSYAEFAEENAELLRGIPPPLVALNYYKSGDLYLFDQFQTSYKGKEPRRPPCNNLYDVFCAIRDDEVEHVKTMQACQNNTIRLDLQNEAAMRQVAEQQQVAKLPASSEEDEQ